jgi:hypothetical protein
MKLISRNKETKVTKDTRRRGISAKYYDHKHDYEIDEYGNGWTKMACQPDATDVCHRHKVSNFQIQSGGSLYKSPRGVGQHTHILNRKYNN